MVGHTGDLDAATRAVEAVDTCLGRVADAVTRQGGALLITADHGNAEMMLDPETGQPHTAHTTNPVPVMLVNGGGVGRNAPIALKNGKLADVAPTLLELMGIDPPADMTGRSLIVAPASRRVVRKPRMRLNACPPPCARRAAAPAALAADPAAAAARADRAVDRRRTRKPSGA